MRPSALLAALRVEFAAAGSPARAEGARVYMKSTMPFHGVDAKTLRAICRHAFAAHPVTTSVGWRRDVLALWRGARFREERYAAIELTGDRRARPFQTMESLPLYEEMIVTGSWWDLVDALATKRLGEILRNEPAPMRKAMRTWSRSGDMWKRRSAILCQITFKRDTNLDLLFELIEPSLSSKEFFLRKAIGWALRSYAWTDERPIVRYVASNRARLSPLSLREALKNVRSSSLEKPQDVREVLLAEPGLARPLVVASRGLDDGAPTPGPPPASTMSRRSFSMRESWNAGGSPPAARKSIFAFR